MEKIAAEKNDILTKLELPKSQQRPFKKIKTIQIY